MKHILLFFAIVALTTCSNAGNDELQIAYQTMPGDNQKCIVVYHPNGASGTPPIDTNVYTINDTVVVLHNQNLYTPEAYFIGWSLSPACTPPILKPGYTFTVTASTMLYACFDSPVYTVIYAPGNADGGTPPVDSNYYRANEIAYILANTGNLYKTGYRFAGWMDDSQHYYQPGNAITIQNQNIQLVAQFIEKPYTVTYLANGANSGSVPVDALFYDSGDTVTIAHNTGNLCIINQDGVSFCFAYWGDSYGTIYIPGNIYTIQHSLQLYAHYRPYVVGDTGPAGGYVLYDKGEYSDGWRYLEVMRDDIIASGIVWEEQLQAGQYRTTGATGTQIGSGSTNTATIVQILSRGQYAAYLCSSQDTGNYADWFLPSKDELYLLFQNKAAIGNFTSYNYWSSSEYSQSNAWYQNFSTGAQSTQYKNKTYRVRAIRRF